MRPRMTCGTGEGRVTCYSIHEGERYDNYAPDLVAFYNGEYKDKERVVPRVCGFCGGAVKSGGMAAYHATLEIDQHCARLHLWE